VRTREGTKKSSEVNGGDSSKDRIIEN
jgi:hypothetical protein